MFSSVVAGCPLIPVTLAVAGKVAPLYVPPGSLTETAGVDGEIVNVTGFDCAAM
jgi:hypothetical protein